MSTILLSTLAYCTIAFMVFRAFKIRASFTSISLAAIVGTLFVGGTVVGLVAWQGAAPISKQITLTRFVVTLNPDLKALIKTIHVDIGERVKKGDLLFELDKAPFQAAVDQYAAQLESAKADVERLNAAVELSEASIKRLEAQRALANAERDAAENLAKKGTAIIAELKVVQVERAADAAEAAVLEGQASAREATFALAAGRANVNSVQGLLDKAEADLQRTSYQAPADGEMINWQARPGTITATLRSSAVGTFMETGAGRIVVVLRQNLLRNVAVGDAVDVAFMSRPGKVDTGKVIRIARYTGEGQFAAQGDVPVLAAVGSKGFFSAIVQLDNEVLDDNLGLGEAGAAAIYTQHGGSLHFLSRFYIRMISLLFYLS